MNIQFMTAANAVTTKSGAVKYLPDFDSLIANASCEEEAEAIRNRVKWYEDRGRKMTFTFEIVCTAFVKGFRQNLKTGKFEDYEEWQIHQHPWYRSGDGVYWTKEQVVEEIERFYKAK